MLSKVSSVSFVGAGNVAWELAHEISNFCTLDFIYSQSGHSAEILAKTLACKKAQNLAELLDSDLIIVAISDQNIHQVAKEISTINKQSNSIIVHTSGSIPAEVLAVSKLKYGVLYPLQTFTKGKMIDLKKVPFCLNAGDQETLNTLKNIAVLISDNVVVMSDGKRKSLHLGAVIVNNFTNHLFFQSKSFLDAHDIEFNYLLPLIEETVRKVKDLGPYTAQTGPARRKDDIVITEHILELDSHPGVQEIYALFSKLIKSSYENHS